MKFFKKKRSYNNKKTRGEVEKIIENKQLQAGREKFKRQKGPSDEGKRDFPMTTAQNAHTCTAGANKLYETLRTFPA